jgi:hypothetical protein
MAILLIGGNKGGAKRFYEQLIPIADRLFDQQLTELKEETEKERKHGRATPVRGTSEQNASAGAKPRSGKS